MMENAHKKLKSLLLLITLFAYPKLVMEKALAIVIKGSSIWGWSDIAVGRALALHVANLGSVPTIPYGLASSHGVVSEFSGETSEHCWVCTQQNNNNKKLCDI